MAREIESIGVETRAADSAVVMRLVHETAQPLTAIACYANGALHRLRREAHVDPQISVALQRIVAETERAERLLRDLRERANGGRSIQLP